MNEWVKSLNLPGFVEKPEGLCITSYTPVDGHVLGHIRCDDQNALEKKINHAREVFLKWRETPAPERGQLVRLIGNAIREHKDTLGSLVSLEMGKSKAEGDGEVQEMIDMSDFALGQSRMLYGNATHSERPYHRMYEQWHPLGIVGLITAFNFPVAVWSWNGFNAAVCGDPVIWKPSPKTPLCSSYVQKLCDHICHQYGYPSIFQTIITNDDHLADKMVNDDRMPLISFTGSTPVGRQVASKVASRFGRCILELGGNNATILDETANLDIAIPAIVFGAVGTAGQRCTSQRRLIIQESIYALTKDALINAYKQVTVGDPLDTNNLMGPVIDEKAIDTFKQVINEAKQQGAKVIYGGNVLDKKGYYVEPTIIEVTPDMPIVKKENFCPILFIVKYQTLDEAIHIHNDVDHGLSSAIFTQNLQACEQFLSASGGDCGIANVNMGTSGAEIGGSFGGEKATGNSREAGSDTWKSYMRRQTTTINFSSDLPLAQGIEFNIKRN